MKDLNTAENTVAVEALANKKVDAINEERNQTGTICSAYYSLVKSGEHSVQYMLWLDGNGLDAPRCVGAMGADYLKAVDKAIEASEGGSLDICCASAEHTGNTTDRSSLLWFGKYKKRHFLRVAREDMKYLLWVVSSLDNEKYMTGKRIAFKEAILGSKEFRVLRADYFRSLRMKRIANPENGLQAVLDLPERIELPADERLELTGIYSGTTHSGMHRWEISQSQTLIIDGEAEGLENGATCTIKCRIGWSSEDGSMNKGTRAKWSAK